MKTLTSHEDISVTIVDGLISGTYSTHSGSVDFRLDMDGDQILYINCYNLVESAREREEDDERYMASVYDREEKKGEWEASWYWEAYCGYEEFLNELTHVLDTDDIVFVGYQLECVC